MTCAASGPSGRGGPSRRGGPSHRGDLYWTLWKIADHSSRAPLDFTVTRYRDGEAIHGTFRMLFGEIGTYYTLRTPHGTMTSGSVDDLLDYLYALATVP